MLTLYLQFLKFEKCVVICTNVKIKLYYLVQLEELSDHFNLITLFNKIFYLMGWTNKYSWLYRDKVKQLFTRLYFTFTSESCTPT